MPNKTLELKKVCKIIALYEDGLGIRVTLRQAGIGSKRTVKKYREIYDRAKEELEVKKSG